jgi:Calcineurin-like phosphoesterase
MLYNRPSSVWASVRQILLGKKDTVEVGSAQPTVSSNEVESPEAAADRQSLQYFIDDFLIPIAADGKLDLKFEDTPLLAAFYAYGIDEMLKCRKDVVDSAFREAIRSAAERGDSPSLANNLVPSWERISQRSSRISKADFEKLRDWFRRQASKPRCEHAFDGVPADIAFGQGSIDPGAIRLFYRLFRDICPDANDEELRPCNLGQINQTTSDRVTSITFEPAFLDELVHRIKTAQLHLREEEIVGSVGPLLTANGLIGMAFDNYRSSRAEQVVVVPPSEMPADDIWFIGDIHGDLLALECTLSYVDSCAATRSPVLVFLGDLFDDGGYSYEVLLRIFDLIARQPGRIAVLAGNHDEALGQRDSLFTSSVSPSEFTDWLNEHAGEPLKRRAGELVIEYFRTAPRALFLPDGLLVAHGGVPHAGRWPGIQRREDFNSPACLQDFVWNRAHERARTRIPSDASRGCEFGYEDFTGFCQLATNVLGQPVERMIRGHDHVEERYLYYAKYIANPILTINAMSRRLSREVFGPYERMPCVAQWVAGQLPVVHRLMIPPEIIREVYPEPQVS